MPKTKLELPDTSFHNGDTIRITDLNYGGHVGNDSISPSPEVRMQFLRHHEYPR